MLWMFYGLFEGSREYLNYGYTLLLVYMREIGAGGALEDLGWPLTRVYRLDAGGARVEPSLDFDVAY